MADFEKRLACVIKADGTVVRGYMIDRCEATGDNGYTITWKIPLTGAAKTNFAATIGSAMDEPVEPGLVTVGLTTNPNQMQVHTYHASGRPARGGRFTSLVSATSSASPAAEGVARDRPARDGTAAVGRRRPHGR